MVHLIPPRKVSICFTCIALCLTVSKAESAESIGVNFTGQDNTGPGPALLSGDTAGVVPQANFNNVDDSWGQDIPLVDASGDSTSMTLNFGGSGGYSSIYWNPGSADGGDEKLNAGFVTGYSTVWATVNNIPYASYDVYVYIFSNSETTVTTSSGTTVYGTTPSDPTATGYIDGNTTTPFNYTEATSTDSANPTSSANYVKFSGLTGSSVTVQTDSPIVQGDWPQGGVMNGFQIVDTSDPITEGAIIMISSVMPRERFHQVD